MADWIKVPSSVYHDAYLCSPRHQIALLIFWATGEVTRWLFTSVVWRKNIPKSVWLENTTTINHEICNCSMQEVWTKCSILAWCASITIGDDTAPPKLAWIPWLHGREDEESVCQGLWEGVCECYVWLRKREGWIEWKRKREAVWEEAAMLAPRRDWEGKGSLLTEWIFKEGPCRGWEGQCVCVCDCIYVKSYWILFYNIIILSFHYASVHKWPPYTSSSPMTDLDPS